MSVRLSHLALLEMAETPIKNAYRESHRPTHCMRHPVIKWWVLYIFRRITAGLVIYCFMFIKQLSNLMKFMGALDFMFVVGDDQGINNSLNYLLHFGQCLFQASVIAYG